MFVSDTMNNVRRLCSLPGDVRPRRWVVRTAVAGYRYLVRNVDTGEYRVTRQDDMRSLY